MSEILFLQVIFLICTTVGFVSALRVFRRYLELKHERTLSTTSDLMQQRLDRIEVSIDAVAVEVERISESNRFVTKLLAERSGHTPAPGSQGRVITPH